MRGGPAVAIAAVLVWACVSGPKSLYDGERAREEVALLEGPYDAAVIGVDDARVRGPAFLLEPGNHRVWIRARFEAKMQGYLYWQTFYCAVPIVAEANGSYTTSVRMKQEAVGALSDGRPTNEVGFDVEVLDASGAPVGEADLCQYDLPRFDG